MFSKSARLKSASPAARRKAVATRKRNRALRKRLANATAKPKTTVFNIADLPTERPAITSKKKYPLKTSAGSDKVQLAREVIALLIQILK